MPELDAFLIPGGGVTEDGKLPPWVEERMDHVIRQYSGEYVIPLSAATTHKPPPYDRHGFPVWEARVGANYLVQRGIPREKILCEELSLDTIGNAYFSRILHADPLGLRRLAVVTSVFHMPRTEFIFRWVYGLDRAPGEVELTFVATPDRGVPPEILERRVQREGESLEGLRPRAARIASMREMHRWMFREHAAYAVGLQPRDETEEVKDLY